MAFCRKDAVVVPSRANCYVCSGKNIIQNAPALVKELRAHNFKAISNLLKMPKIGGECRRRKKGYRRRLCPPKKRGARYKSLFKPPYGFCGFDEPPLKPIRCLSLFDGIGTALHVLDSLNLQVEAYYSSEVDEKAIDLLRFRYPNRITMLGCVTSITEEKLLKSNIDLLLGGSPCADLSLANPNRKNLHGAGSTGSLFFHYHRILSVLQRASAQAGRPLYWLFENTFHMEKSTTQDISRYLQCTPIVRCASNYVPMKRKRYFWGNIPCLSMPRPEVPPAFKLQDILKPHRIANFDILPTLTTTYHSQQKGRSKQLPVQQDGKDCGLLIVEEELLFGLGEHYTDGPNLSIRDRRKLLGKAWAAPVVADLLQPLTRLFLTK